MKIKKIWKRSAKKHTVEQAKIAHDQLLAIAKLTVRFADVNRAPRYPNGNRENDAEHSFHLALSATELAVNYYPKLDVGLVSQFSLVHDLPESYSGDVWTININQEDRDKKENAEKEATQKLIKELPPHISQLLKRYEKQQEPEARFVRFVDKLLPDLIQILAGDSCTFKEDHNIKDIDEFNQIFTKHRIRMKEMFPEFEFIHYIHELVSKTLSDSLFK